MKNKVSVTRLNNKTPNEKRNGKIAELANKVCVAATKASLLAASASFADKDSPVAKEVRNAIQKAHEASNKLFYEAFSAYT